MRILLDPDARKVLRAVAVAVVQFSRFLLPAKNVQAVVASASALVPMEHGLAESVVVGQSRRALGVRGANQFGYRAGHHSVVSRRVADFGPAHFQPLFVGLAEEVILAVAHCQLSPGLVAHEGYEGSPASPRTPSRQAIEHVCAVLHVAEEALGAFFPECASFVHLVAADPADGWIGREGAGRPQPAPEQNNHVSGLITIPALSLPFFPARGPT